MPVDTTTCYTDRHNKNVHGYQTRHRTGHNTVGELWKVQLGPPRATLPVPHEVLEVIVDVSREIFHFNILTSASICRHDSLLKVHSVASQI